MKLWQQDRLLILVSLFPVSSIQTKTARSLDLRFWLLISHQWIKESNLIPQLSRVPLPHKAFLTPRKWNLGAQWQPTYRGMKYLTRNPHAPHPTAGWRISFLQKKVDNSPGERSGLRGVEAWTATQQLYTAADDKQDLLDIQQVLRLDKTQGVVTGIY